MLHLVHEQGEALDHADDFNQGILLLAVVVEPCGLWEEEVEEEKVEEKGGGRGGGG